MDPVSSPKLLLRFPVKAPLLSAAVLAVALVSWLVPSTGSAQIGEPYVLDEPTDGEPADGGDSAGDAEEIEGEAATDEALDSSAGRPPAYFRQAWQARRRALAEGNAKAAEAKLEEMTTAKAKAGWPDFFVYGRALERESAVASGVGDFEEAIRLGRAAVAFAPDQPSSYLTLASARWGAGEILDAAGSVLNGVIVSTFEPPLLRAHLGNVYLALIIGLFVAAAGFAIMSIYRYARVMLHDLRHILPRGARPWQAGLVAGALFVMPVLLRLGIVWVIIWWVVCLGVYFRPRERAAAILIVAGLAAVAVFLPRASTFLGYAGSTSQTVYLAARNLGADSLAADMAAKPKTTADEKYALGLRAAWSGEPHKAAAWLDGAVAAGADDPELFTMLGNVRYAVGEQKEAVEAYERAVQVDASNLIAYFNMSRVYFAIGEHQKGNVAYRKASAIDFEKAEEYAKLAKSVGRGFIVPATVSRRILALEVKPVASHALAVEEVWGWLAGQTSRMVFALGAILGVILLALLAFIHKPLKLALSCPRCGMAACRRCNPEMPDLNQCGQCYHAFVLKDGVEDQLRIEKEIASHRYRASTARVARLFSVALAGAGHMIKGASLRGLLLMLIFATSMTGLLATVGIIPAPDASADTALDTITLILTASIALVTYILSLWDGARAG